MKYCQTEKLQGCPDYGDIAWWSEMALKVGLTTSTWLEGCDGGNLERKGFMTANKEGGDSTHEGYQLVWYLANCGHGEFNHDLAEVHLSNTLLAILDRIEYLTANSGSLPFKFPDLR
jgi:hypothetical protein